MRDVTEARRREAVRETFIGVLSHELRTPGHDDLRWRQAAGAADVDPRRGDARGIFRDIARRGRAAPAPGRGRRRPQPLRRRGAATSGPSRSSSSASCRRVVESEEGRWPGVTFEIDVAAGPADGHRRPDLRRAGRPQPAVERRQVRRHRGDRDVVVEAGRRARSSSGSSTTDRASRPTRRDRLFELFFRSARRPGGGRRRDRPVRLRAADRGRWAAGSGRAPREDGGAEFGFALASMREETEPDASALDPAPPARDAEDRQGRRRPSPPTTTQKLFGVVEERRA